MVEATATVNPRKAWRRLRYFLWCVVASPFIVIAGGQMGLLSGNRPADLGFSAGKFKPCSWKPNCVNSTTDAKADAAHFITPLSFEGDAATAWKKLVTVVKAAPGAKVVREDDGYLYAEFNSRMMGFTDDVELALDATGRQIHARSASRMGVRDFGVNRARIEDIRARFGAGK